MKLRFTPRATQDLLEIASYLRTRNPAAALRVRDSILDAMQTLVLFPRSGRPQALEGVRKLVTRQYRYLVYYSVDTAADELAVLSIQHPAQDREFADRH